MTPAPSLPDAPARRTIEALVIAASVLFGTFVVVLAFPNLIGAEASYVVLSDSMEPTFGSGDVVVIDDAAPGDIEQGDIITYREPGRAEPRYVTHRVVEANHSGGDHTFRTKGDANDDPDPYTVSGDRVVGRYWFDVPYVGRLMLFARTTVGIVLLVLVPATALLGWSLRTLLREFGVLDG